MGGALDSAPPASEPTAPGWLAGDWVPVGLWTGIAAGALRGAALYFLERAHDGSDLQARMRLAAYLPQTLITACAIGLLCTALARLARTRRARGGRAVGLMLVWALAAFALHAFAVGRLDGDLSREIGTATARGREAVRALGGVSALLALAAVVLVGRSRARGLSAAALLPPVLVAIALPAGWRLAYGEHPATMLLHENVGCVLDLPFEVQRAHPRMQPHVEVLCPSPNYTLDGADMRSLVLPPPAEVVVTPGGVDLPARLFGRVGLDRTVILRHEQELVGHTVRFDLFVDDERAFEIDIPVARPSTHPGTEWRDFAGDEGVPVPAGARLRFVTTLLGPDGAPVEFARPLLVGFGGLTFEHRTPARRTLSSPEHPNVVLIVMDTLRADRLSTYGYERPTSPNLDRLAARGLLFEEAYAAASWTWPSTASILTGLLPFEHGVESGTASFLADELETIAEVAQHQGMTTAAWSGNPLIVPDKNFDQGFEFFEHGKGATRKSAMFVPGALEWIESTGNTRFFAYLHLVDPHAPARPLRRGRVLFAADVPDSFSGRAINDYDAKLLDGEGHAPDGTVQTDACVPPDHQRWISELYDAEVWTGDQWLGQVMDRLERSGLTDRTVVVFTSDHGEELFDHGLLTHGRTLYREVVHVPLVMAGPGIPRGTRIDVPVSNRHVAPTIARLMGGALPAVTDALNLAALDADPPQPERALIFSTTQGWWNGQHPVDLMGLRRGAWVLQVAPQGAPWGAEFPGPGEMRLFDVRADPGETTDLSKEWDAVARGMRQILETRKADLERRSHAVVAPGGESTVETLRGLGYLDDE